MKLILKQKKNKKIKSPAKNILQLYLFLRRPIITIRPNMVAQSLMRTMQRMINIYHCCTSYLAIRHLISLMVGVPGARVPDGSS